MKIFFLVCGFSFHYLINIIQRTVLNFDKVQFIIMFFVDCAFGVVTKKS